MSAFLFGPLRIDPAEYGSRGNAILGIKDSGKTYTATWFAERLHVAGIPFVAFDPSGAWRFLRRPGKGPGLPVVVAGGVDADLPLAPATAPAIVEAAMRGGVSLVLDMSSQAEYLSKADWRRIVRDCMRVLLARNAPHGLRHVFVEEASEFCPQRVFDGETYAEVEKLARIGGNARLGYTLVNQRAEEVNKAVLELCDNLLLHRQKGRNSLVALGKWLDVGAVRDHKAVVGTLATLPTGECWAWMAEASEAIRVKVPGKNSFHPDRRLLRGVAGAAAPKAVDVADFVEAMRTALPAIAADVETNDPKQLRAEVARLKELLAKAEGPRDPSALEASYAHGLAEGRRERDAWRKTAKSLHASLEQITKVASSVARIDFIEAPSIEKPMHHHTPSLKSNGTVKITGSIELSGPQRQLLGALRWWQVNGFDEVTRIQAAMAAGWKPTSGHIANVLGSLRTAGLVDYPSPGEVRLTTEGRTAAPEPDDDDRGLHDRVRAVLDGPQRQVFDYLLKHDHAREHARETLARGCGWEPTSGHIANVLGSLRTLGVVDYPQRGHVALAEWLR